MDGKFLKLEQSKLNGNNNSNTFLLKGLALGYPLSKEAH
jgi:hypothetical protein